MRTLDKTRQVVPPGMSAKDIEMARVAQRCIMEALDQSRADAITLTTDSGEHPTVEVPPAALKLMGQLLGAMNEGRPIDACALYPVAMTDALMSLATADLFAAKWTTRIESK